MKVAFYSYPTLFQNSGGLQVQILETISAVRKLGIQARLIDMNCEQISAYDLLHVFSVANGNHRSIELASDRNIPVIVSSLLQPHWNRRLGALSRILETVSGHLTGWNVKTEYRHFASALNHADAIIALGDTEKRSIIDAFGIDKSRIRVIPNGIPQRYFEGNPEDFQRKFGIDSEFVLCVASINPHKNQLGLAKALASTGIPLILIGPCLTGDKQYLEEILRFPRARYLGPMDYDDPLLASAYAAASVFCLPSNSEVMPLSVMEALASGTPVVMTRNHCMDVSAWHDIVHEISPKNQKEIDTATRSLLARKPPAERCRDAVRGYTWDAVGSAILRCYHDVLAKRGRSYSRRPDITSPRGDSGDERSG